MTVVRLVRGGVAVALMAMAGSVLLYSHAVPAHAAATVAEVTARTGDPYGNEPRDAAYAVPGVLDYRSWKPSYDVAAIGGAPSTFNYRRLAIARERALTSETQASTETVAPSTTALAADLPATEPDTTEANDTTPR